MAVARKKILVIQETGTAITTTSAEGVWCVGRTTVKDLSSLVSTIAVCLQVSVRIYPISIAYY